MKRLNGVDYPEKIDVPEHAVVRDSRYFQAACNLFFAKRGLESSTSALGRKGRERAERRKKR